MTDQNKDNTGIRFFENTAINRQGDETVSNDPKPFGLEFQELCPKVDQAKAENGMTMTQSPTNTPSGPDSCLDIDAHF